MKKCMFSAIALSALLFANAAQNDALVTFSTPGPDKYADGSTVLDGECYALVWTEKAGANAVFAADGTVDGGKMVLAAPVAKDGRCPTVLFEIDAAKYSTELKSGSWDVYLLDTRKWGDDGVPRVAGMAGGTVALVNAADKIAAAGLSLRAGSISSTAGTEGTVASTQSALPEEALTTQPVVTGIRVAGGKVFVSVKGTLPCLQYALFAGDSPDCAQEKDGAPRSGAEAIEDEIILVTDAEKNGAFFRVGRSSPK